MKATNTLASLLWLLPLACGGKYIDLAHDEMDPTQSGETETPQGAGANQVATGASSGGSDGGGDATSRATGGGWTVTLQRGGFAGALLTLEGGVVDVGQGNAACDGPGSRSFYSYNANACLAASACLYPCDPQDLLTQQPYIYFWLDDDYTTRSPFVEAECRTASSSGAFLVHPCGEGDECPRGTTCADTEVGRSCLVQSTVWAAACADNYCMSGNGNNQVSPPERCGAETKCCSGQVCTASGACEPGECSRLSDWCDEESPCCDGLACQDSACAAP